MDEHTLIRTWCAQLDVFARDAFTDLAGYDSGESFDEMMALSAQLFILASCGSFVGTLHHNFGQIVWELMSARTYRPTPDANDMSGSAFFSGWWASGPVHGPLHVNPMTPTKRIA